MASAKSSFLTSTAFGRYAADGVDARHSPNRRGEGGRRPSSCGLGAKKKCRRFARTPQQQMTQDARGFLARWAQSHRRRGGAVDRLYAPPVDRVGLAGRPIKTGEWRRRCPAMSRTRFLLLSFQGGRPAWTRRGLQPFAEVLRGAKLRRKRLTCAPAGDSQSLHVRPHGHGLRVRDDACRYANRRRDAGVR